MKEILKKAGYISILSSVAFLLLGIILVNHPDNTIKFVSYILGSLFIVFGLARIKSYFSSPKEDFLYYDYNLTIGSLCTIIGLVILVFGNALASIIGFIFGIWIVLSAINKINLSFKIKKAGVKYWYVSVLISLLVLIAGLYIVFSPELILVTLGTILIIYSVMDIIEDIIFMINMKQFLK